MSEQKYFGKKYKNLEKQIGKFARISGSLSSKDIEEIEEIQGEIERLTTNNFQKRDFLEEKLTKVLVLN